ncbi:MAG: CehA/McbA family metallohydrolase [Hyphomicrobiales bacterium]|nr:CehA/McbA family metallohydrolase [Hyphomicrobiales bacterium]
MPSLSPFSLPGRFWRGNLHTHSNLSDGALEPPQVIEAYKNAGYDFMMLSDHFIGHYNWPVADTRAMRSNNFTTIIGSELHAPETSVGELWHIVAAGLPLDFPPAGKNETGAELARRAHAAGAFIGIAHPAWSQLTMADGRAIDCAHAVEIYNHGCAIENDRGDGWYLLDQLLNEGRRLTAFATDDAHFKTPDYFGGWVHVKAESLGPEVLLEALKKGHYYSSQGPQIHDITVSGSEISIRCSPVDNITVLCGNSRTLVRNAKSITEATFDLKKLETGWLLTKLSPWFRAVCIDHAGKKAWSNPIWKDEL